MNLEEQYRALIESIKLAAAPYSMQISNMPSYVNIVDEVVNTYEEAFYLLPELIINNYVSKEATASLIKLFTWINLTSKDESLCTTDALRTNVRWGEIRKYAKESLDTLDESSGPPDLSHIKWIKG